MQARRIDECRRRIVGGADEGAAEGQAPGARREEVELQRQLPPWTAPAAGVAALSALITTVLRRSTRGVPRRLDLNMPRT